MTQMTARDSYGRGGTGPRQWKAAVALASAGLATIGLSGCGSAAATDSAGTDSPATDSPSTAPSVIATTTVLGDVTGQVAECAGLEVRTLMPVGADPHDYSPSTADVSDLVEADLVVANGLGLEGGLTAALESAQADGATILEVAPLLDPIPMSDTHAHEHEGEGEAAHEGEGGDGHDHGSLDPHVWLDAGRMAEAARLIGAELADVTGDDALTTCGNEVGDSLDEVDATVRETLAAVPAERRVLITDHAAFGYFADAYDFQVPGVVIPGGSTLAQPSSAELTALADAIRAAGVDAIFANTALATDLIDALAGEVGQVEVVPLYVGSLGPQGSGAETYADMMTTNARLIADALAE